MSTDPLIDQINKVSGKVKQAAYDGKKAYDQSAVGRFQKDATIFTKFIYGVGRSSKWIYINTVAPISKATYKISKWIFWKYVSVWNKLTYVDDSYGKKVFSKIRGAVMMLTTACFCWYLLMPILELGLYDIPLYALTSKHHVAYLNIPTVVNGDKNIHAAQGCDTHPDCDQQDTVHYRIRATAFNHAYSLIHHGTPYYPDFVAAAVPAVPAKCDVHTYGIRWTWFVKNFNLFPDMLEVRCTPLK